MSNALPLSGLRVLDFTQALAGPFCTMILGDLGADVIKVETAGKGDDTRGWGPPFVEGTGSYFFSANRNKRSIIIDLKSAEGHAAAIDLAASSDIVVENWRPGTAAKLRIGPSDLRDRFPKLIYCSISGFGATGPNRLGYDQVIQGMSGWMSLTGEPAGTPMKVGLPIADLSSGLFAALTICAVAREREKTGVGKFVDIAMLDSMASLLSYQACSYFVTGAQPKRQGNMHGTIVPYGSIETEDGLINMTVGNDSQWQKLCSGINAEELGKDERFLTNPDRVKNRDVLYPLLQQHTRKWKSAQLIDALDKAGVPAGPVWNIPQLFESEDVRSRSLRLDAPHRRYGQVSTVGQPWRINGDAAEMRKLPPEHGEHTAEILGEVGRSK
ncbi:formyl-CoA transferase [Bradyrhizobium centrolobii]|uniref:Formyl-CoA transferase n=1 Tax=Bradyrhizobium centrolobii TaxID=1505087 RepID=A0A176YYM6_9BRAD|nr:CoA transferase [Bradyrhizobium centrolobii]OAF12318.1 formyl-CoA transferase [Bradyrhizobium centrolobii]